MKIEERIKEIKTQTSKTLLELSNTKGRKFDEKNYYFRRIKS